MVRTRLTPTPAGSPVRDKIMMKRTTSVYVLRWADGSTPFFADTLAEIAARFDLPGFDADDAAFYADMPAHEIDIEIRDEAGDKLAWIVAA